MIPNRPLNFRSGDLTIDDMIALDEIGGNMTAATMLLLKRVLTQATDWTPDEIGQIRLRELTQVMQQMSMDVRAEEDAAVPPASGNASLVGQLEPARLSPVGSDSLRSLDSGASLPGSSAG